MSIAEVTADPNPSQNHLLAALPAVEFARWPGTWSWSRCYPVQCFMIPVGNFSTPISHHAIISLHYVMESGAVAETAGVGREGVVGISLFMGGDTTPSSAVVQTAGHAYRLERRLLLQEFNRAGLMQRLLLRYTQALMTQIAQTAACNRHHSVEQRLCRWLLLTLDRISSLDLVMTQELIAGILGVRREGITDAAGDLQRAGAIRYRRGHIAVLDRSFWRPGPASVTRSSRQRWTACCPMSATARVLVLSRRLPSANQRRDSPR